MTGHVTCNVKGSCCMKGRSGNHIRAGTHKSRLWMMPPFERPLFVDGLASALRRPRAAAATKNGFAVAQLAGHPTNKSLAQINKSLDVGRATKKRSGPTISP